MAVDSLDLIKGMLDVIEQVLNIFDSNGEADERVRDAQGRAGLSGHGGMSHDGGVIDERLDTTERLGKCEDPDSFEESA